MRLETSFSKGLGLLVLLALLSACAGGDARKATTGRASGSGGYYKVGRPYQIKGNWYYPEENYSYDETGIASWYGADFHDQKTANGEIYNKNELTAAHKTLPMPSLARVTNLENGRAIVVRINDRGPFSGARIIDVSQRSAKLLGFENQGTAKVRVQVLADESRAIAEAMRTYGGDKPSLASAAPPSSPPSSPSVEVAPFVETAPLPPPSSMTLANVRPVPEYVQLPVTGKNQIFVQAGAFTSAENAQKLKKKLSVVGAVNIVQALVKGTQYYRVRLGPIDSVAQADKALKRVVGAGAPEARIIVD